MEKQLQQQDSISSVGVGMGKEYPPSEAYSSEPPPAYQRPRATAVQIARIAAGTVIAVTVILGFFMLASAYISATMSCTTFNNLEALRQELEEQPQYQHLVAVDPLQSEESSDNKRESLVPPPPPPASNVAPAPAGAGNQQGDFNTPIQIKLPLTLDFDDLAGALVEKNQRSRMNCVVEKRRAEEVMDHQPKTVRLPFGVNLTTDPRYEHVTGERMAIFCESGNDQRHVPVDNSIATPIVLPMPFHHGGETAHLIPIPMPMGPHGPMMPPQMQHGMPPQMQHGMAPQIPHGYAPQMPPQQVHMRQPPQQLFHPPPPQMQQPLPHPHPAQTQAVPLPPSLPLELLARIAQEAQEEAGDGKDDSPVHIIAREEIFPIFHPANPEGRSLNAAPVPAEMVQPPPPPPQYAPRHLVPPPPQQLQTTQLHPANDEPTRPHYVQPRSVRSVDDAFLKRDKRVKRCACDCAC